MAQLCNSVHVPLQRPSNPALRQNEIADVVVVGAGIAGEAHPARDPVLGNHLDTWPIGALPHHKACDV